MQKNVFFAAGLFLAATATSFAQDNYEIQVYGSETMAPGHTMVELHSNFTINGSKGVEDGLNPTNHALHETIEITQGINDWFETGFYIFTSYNPEKGGYGWVGDHIRPRVRVPESWKWPVGISLSAEFGYQRRQYSLDTWSLELRPIIDKQLGRWYLSFNPTIDRAFHGPGIAAGVTFSPNFKAGYDVTKKVNVGIEYYGSLGPVTGFDPIHDQQQQIIPAIDLNLSPDWEFNAGIGVGVTGATDHLIVKFIVGRRFNFGGKSKAARP
ncbi:MAG: hypothetical protein ABJC09_14110 [Terriglobia bacterium]